VLEDGEVALDGAGVYDGVFVAPGAVAPWALGGVAPVGPPSAPLCAPGVVVVALPVTVPVVGVPVSDPALVPVASVVGVTESSVSSGASRPPLD
jgi:hypothetical protein